MEFLLFTVLIYLAIGVLLSVFFLWKGIERVDIAAAETAWSFRLILLPGLCITWPYFLVKWITL